MPFVRPTRLTQLRTMADPRLAAPDVPALLLYKCRPRRDYNRAAVNVVRVPIPEGPLRWSTAPLSATPWRRPSPDPRPMFGSCAGGGAAGAIGRSGPATVHWPPGDVRPKR